MPSQTALIKTTPQSLQKIGTALAITEKLLQEDNPLGLPDLIPYRKGDKWGFCNRKKEIVIECVYDEMFNIDHQNFICKDILYSIDEKKVISRFNPISFNLSRDNEYIIVERDEEIIISKIIKHKRYFNIRERDYSECDCSEVTIYLFQKQKNKNLSFILERTVEDFGGYFINNYSYFTTCYETGKWDHERDNYVLHNYKGERIDSLPLDDSLKNSSLSNIKTPSRYVHFSYYAIFKVFSNGFTFVKKVNDNKNLGIILNLNKEKIIENIVDVQDFSEGLLAVKLNQKKNWLYIDESGNIKLKTPFSKVGDFKEGLADFLSKDNLWGYINNKGKTIIEAKYQKTTAFNLGHSIVSIDNSIPSLLINTKGEIVKISQTSQIERISDELIFCKDYIFNIETAEQINFDLQSNESMSFEPLNRNFFIGIKTIVGKGFYFGITNKYGQIIIPCTYLNKDTFRPITDYLFEVRNGESYSLIDINGNTIFSEYIEIFTNGISVPTSGWFWFYHTPNNKHKNKVLVLRDKNHQVGAINCLGETIIPFKYKNLIWVTDDNYWIAEGTNGLMGIINEKENVNFYYETLISYKNRYKNLWQPSDKEIFIAQKNGKTGLIDRHENPVVNFEYDSFETIFKDIKSRILIIAKKGNKYGVIDTNGNIMVKFLYDGLEVSKIPFNSNHKNVFAYDVSKFFVWNYPKEFRFSANFKNSLPVLLKVTTNEKMGFIDLQGSEYFE